MQGLNARARVGAAAPRRRRRAHRGCPGVSRLLLLWACILTTGTVALWADAALAAHEIWVASRADGQPGTGTPGDPFDGSKVDVLNALFARCRSEYGANLTIHFGPGVFYGDRLWEPLDNWKIRGAGMDVTIFRSVPDPNGIGTVGFRAGGYTGGPSGFEISDVTFDFNVPALRRANRAFVYDRYGRPAVCYWYLEAAPAWSAEADYKRGAVVTHADNDYVAVKPGRNQPPGQNDGWSILRANRATDLPTWEPGRDYALGAAVARDGAAFISLGAKAGLDPAVERASWQALDPSAPDPRFQAQAEGLRHVRIADNVLRTVSGAGRARAIGVLRAQDATVSNNTGEPGMYMEVPADAVCRDNTDLQGRPLRLTRP